MVLFILTACLGRPPAIADTGASAYLPGDGFRVRFSNDAGSMASEWARDQASGLINGGPTHFSYWLSQAGLSWDTTQAARLSTVYANPLGKVTAREDDFMVESPGGVSTGVEVRSWSASRFFYPARLDLNSQMAAGRSWVSEGKAWVLNADGSTQKTTYRADYAATAPSNTDERVRRCLVITMNLTIGQIADPPLTRTWCPGLGIVTLSDGQSAWQSGTDSIRTAVTPETGFDWSTAARLQFSPLTINDFTKQGALQIAPMTAPALLRDGTPVAVQKVGKDAVALNTEVDPVRTRWRVRAGGMSTATATFNDLTLIANSNRQLIAYDSTGRWVWQAPLNDLAEVPPVRLGSLAIVATVDGSVTAFDLGSGAVSWSHRLPAEIRLNLSVGGDRVVAADQTGTITCFDPHGVQQWSIQPGPVGNFAITSGAIPMVVVRERGENKASGYALADGNRVWQLRTDLGFATMIPLDGEIVVRDDNLTTGLDPLTGATQWTWQEARTYAAIGGQNRVLLLAVNRLILLDDQGHQVKDWQVSVPELGQKATFLSSGVGRVLVWAPKGILLGVAP